MCCGAKKFNLFESVFFEWHLIQLIGWQVTTYTRSGPLVVGHNLSGNVDESARRTFSTKPPCGFFCLKGHTGREVARWVVAAATAEVAAGRRGGCGTRGDGEEGEEEEGARKSGSLRGGRLE